jgi:hypothetical protein
VKKQHWLIVAAVALVVTGLTYYLNHELGTLEKNISEMEGAVESNTSAIYQSVEVMNAGLIPDMRAMQEGISKLNENVEMMRQDMNKLASSTDKMTKTIEEIIEVFIGLWHNPVVRLLCSI